MKRSLQKTHPARTCPKFIAAMAFCLSLILSGGLPATAAASESADAAEQPRQAINGTVMLEQNVPALGATVVVKGDPNRGTMVSADGTFVIYAVPGETLVVTLIGYIRQEVAVGTATSVNVLLREEIQSIDDVVVVGYGVQRKETVTGAINSVGAEDILKSPAASVSNSLAGRLPGLTVVQRSGEPGSDGASFRIRGIPTLNDGDESAPLIVIDGIPRDNLDLLDANEISSINVLKDASATAVFGVRGANGAILITTQTGSSGKPKVTLTGNFGFQSYTMMPQLVNAYEWGTLYNEGLANEGSSKAPFNDEIMQYWKDGSSPVIFPDTDWVDKMFRKAAPQQHYNVNVSGGTDKVKYFVSFGMLDQKGIYKEHDIEGIDFSVNPNYRRFNLRSNLDIKITKNLELNVRLASVFTDGNYSNASTGLIFDYVTRTVPGGGVGIVNGKLITGYSGDDPMETAGRRVSNPIYEIYKDGFREYNSSTYNLSANLKYDMGFLLKGLNVAAKVAYDDFGTHQIKYTPAGIPSYTVVISDYTDPDGYELVRNTDAADFTAAESYSNKRYRKTYLEASINYARRFGKHNVSALAVYMQETSSSPDYQYDLPKGLVGFAGRATYNYDNRYMAEVNVGYNGSENFAEDKRFGFFPAFSAGWLLTQEKFIPKNKYLTYAKIRGSYGEVGNDKIGKDRFLYLPSTFEYNTNSTGGYNWGTNGKDIQYYPGSKEGKVGNPDVTWERAKKTNVGVDIKMFGDKFNLTADLFWEKRDKILWEYGTVPSIWARKFTPANIGKVNNKGFEIEAGWNSKIGRDFNYWLNGSFSYAKNEIIYKDEALRQYPYLAETGYSVNQYKGYVNEGFINTIADLENQPAHGWGSNWDRGELNFIDVNGDGIIDSNDKVTIGYSPYPEITYGFGIGFSWKNFDFSALFQGAANVTLYLRQSAVCPLYYSRSAQKWHMGRWTEERYLAGENITYPRMLADNITSPSFIDQNPMSTFWLYDASYLRLRNVELAYNIRSQGLKGYGISSIRVFVSGSNLLTFSNLDNFDPEAPSGIGSFYPMQKVYNIGFKIIF